MKAYVAEDGGVVTSVVSTFYLFSDDSGPEIAAGVGISHRWNLAAILMPIIETIR